MRLRAASDGGGLRGHRGGSGTGDIGGVEDVAADRAGQQGAARCQRGCSARGRDHGVRVRWHLGRQQRHVFGTGHLANDVAAQPRALALVDGQAATQVGHGEGALAIAAVGGADEDEQGFVLGDRQQAAVAGLPADGGAAEAEHANFADIRCGHETVLRMISLVPWGRAVSRARGRCR
ncbi:hypothetical protein D9M68_805410 [compost metagenome]